MVPTWCSSSFHSVPRPSFSSSLFFLSFHCRFQVTRCSAAVATGGGASTKRPSSLSIFRLFPLEPQQRASRQPKILSGRGAASVKKLSPLVHDFFPRKLFPCTSYQVPFIRRVFVSDLVWWNVCRFSDYEVSTPHYTPPPPHHPTLRFSHYMFRALRRSPDSLPSCCTASHPPGRRRGRPAMWKDRDRGRVCERVWARGRKEGRKRWNESRFSFCHLFRVRDAKSRLWGFSSSMLFTLACGHTHTPLVHVNVHSHTHTRKSELVRPPAHSCSVCKTTQWHEVGCVVLCLVSVSMWLPEELASGTVPFIYISK